MSPLTYACVHLFPYRNQLSRNNGDHLELDFSVLTKQNNEIKIEKKKQPKNSEFYRAKLLPSWKSGEIAQKKTASAFRKRNNEIYIPKKK